MPPIADMDFAVFSQSYRAAALLAATPAREQLEGRAPARSLPRNRYRQISECMRRLAKQFELSSQRRDPQIRLGAREVGLKCV
jgi:hypothetical protein